MTDYVTFPIPSRILDPSEYPEFKGEQGDPGPATEWQTSETHLQARPVGGSTWVDVVALSELTGADGAAGAAGTEGADGNTIISGSGAPSGGLGADGDYYLDIAATLLYGPKAAGAWPAGVQLKGEDGAATLPAQITEGEISAGTETELRSYAPADVVALIDEHAPVAAGVEFDTLAELNAILTDATLDRSSASRTPTAHNTSHQSGGADAIKLDDLGTPDDNTDLNASTDRHGLLPKLSGVSTEFLNGVGAFATPAGGSGGLADPTLERENDFGVDVTGATAFNGGTVTLDAGNSRVTIANVSTDKGVYLSVPTWEASKPYVLVIDVTYTGASNLKFLTKWNTVTFASIRKSGVYAFQFTSDATPGNVVIVGTTATAETFYINYYAIYKYSDARKTFVAPGVDTLLQPAQFQAGYAAHAQTPNLFSGINRGSVAVGNQANAGCGVAIGYQATAAKVGANTKSHVVIGDAASASSTSSDGAVVVGAGAAATQSEVAIGTGAVGGGSASTVIGNNASCAPSTAYSPSATAGTCVAIGANAKALSWRALAFGNDSIAAATSTTVIGVGGFAASPHQTVIGRGSHFYDASNASVFAGGHTNIGGDEPGSPRVYFHNSWCHYADTPPNGITNSNFATPSTREINLHGQDAYDSRATPSDFNVAAGHLVLASGRGTGTGAGGEVRIKTAPAAGAGQNVKNALVSAAVFDSATGLTDNKTRFLLLDTTTGTYRRVQFGAADSGGSGFRALIVEN